MGQEKIPIILMTFAFLSLLFALTNEGLGENKPAKLFYQISCGIAYLLAFAIYTNKYLYEMKKNRDLSNILGLILWGSLIAISFPFYIRWCGVTKQNFDAFITVYAALLGGAITLAGVAWTINDGNLKRQEDLQRIEEERKLDERKRHIPYLKLIFEEEVKCEVHACIYRGIDLEKSDSQKQFENNIFYQITIENFTVKNVSGTNIILSGIYFMGRYYKFVDSVILEKEGLCRIKTTDNWSVILAKEEKALEIIVSDILGNVYSLECKLNYKPCGRGVIEEDNNGEKLTGFKFNCNIANIKLPVFQKCKQLE